MAIKSKIKPVKLVKLNSGKFAPVKCNCNTTKETWYIDHNRSLYTGIDQNPDTIIKWFLINHDCPICRYNLWITGTVLDVKDVNL
jgi:hypothetical protein